MSIKKSLPGRFLKSFLGWLKGRDVTNFEALLGLVSLFVTCIGAGFICFYIGVKYVCKDYAYDYASERNCVVYNIGRALGYGDD